VAISRPLLTDIEIIKTTLQTPIVLCGMMGSGKTSIGYTVAAMLSAPFIDLDQYIESNHNLSITQIFAQHGEAFFRHAELESLTKILTNNHKKLVVISLGGGAFCRDEAVKLINKNCISVFLNADGDLLYSRVSGNKTRPLVVEKQDFINCLNLRLGFYKMAHIEIAIKKHLSKNAVAKNIISEVSKKILG
jgi:shikimate kinase